ncbi:MAG: hypothetical protein EFT35_05830 [Methanophagales archaeon ANME-1-THS]|nr:MAG: hypothetical protein EFT35_05830 [Methanophagales archaeon ANME-1-THS]
MAMKVRVEVTDEEGMKTSMEKEGDLQTEMLKQLTIRDVTRFLEAQLSPLSNLNPYDSDLEDLTIKERLASFLRYDERAPKEWFTSSELRRRYEAVFEEDVRLSTISTYLASMHSEGMLERKGSRAKRQYRVVPTESVAAPRAVHAV